jgi:hypothetical protein
MVGLTGLAVAVWLWPPPASPEQHLRQKLAAGQSVDLLAEGRRPAYERVLYGPAGGSPCYVGQDGAFTVETQDLVVVELVPPGACSGGYHLKAQVRFDQGEPGVGRGGLYVAHTRRQVGEDEVQFFAEWGFTDDAGPLVPDDLPPLGPDVLRGRYSFLLRRSPELPPKPRTYFEGSLRGAEAFFTHPEAPGGSGEWRDLEIEVRADEVRLTWEGQALPPIPAAALAKAAKAYFQKLIQPPPEFNAAGGVGLVVYKASISFRSATIRPLPEVPADQP